MTARLSPQREVEIAASVPPGYEGPWSVHPEMVDRCWLVGYPTDNPLAGLVAKVPDYGFYLAEFIAIARNAIPELLAELAAVRAELAAREESLAFADRVTYPDLRREIEHHKASKERWRERAEKAEVERDEAQADAVRVSETLNRRLSQEQLAGSALYAALTMPTTPEQRQAALDQFTAVTHQAFGRGAPS